MSVHAVHAVQCPTPNPQPSTSFALRNTDGFWELTFDGQSAVLRQHPALFYVAWLLADPPAAPVPAHVLAAKVADLFAMHSDFFRTRFWIALPQEQFAQVLVHQQQALEAILEREDELEPVKEEALRELSAVYEMHKHCLTQIATSAQRAAEVLADGLRSLHASLATAVDGRGNPHPVLRPFAFHLLVHLLMPSTRSSARFTYQPPEGVAWRNDE